MILQPIDRYPRLMKIVFGMNVGLRRTTDPVLQVRVRSHIAPQHKDELSPHSLLYLGVLIGDKEVFGQFQGFEGPVTPEVFEKVENDIIAHMVSRGILEVYSNMTDPNRKLRL